MTLKTPVYIDISSTLPGGLFRPNEIFRVTRLPQAINLASIYLGGNSSGRAAPGIPFQWSSPHRSTYSQSVSLLPLTSHSPMPSKFRYKETISTMGKSESHPGLEASCFTSANQKLSWHSFQGPTRDIPQESQYSEKPKAIASCQVIL